MAFGDRLFKEVMKPGQICNGLLICGTVLDLGGAVQSCCANSRRKLLSSAPDRVSRTQRFMSGPAGAELILNDGAWVSVMHPAFSTKFPVDLPKRPIMRLLVPPRQGKPWADTPSLWPRPAAEFW